MRTSNARVTAQLLYSSIHCIDDILNESFEDAVDSYNSLAFPQLTDLDQSQFFADRCQNWLVEPAPIEVKGPVNSDVRTLILQGAYERLAKFSVSFGLSLDLHRNLHSQARHSKFGSFFSRFIVVSSFSPKYQA
jgi:hypothetical protein